MRRILAWGVACALLSAPALAQERVAVAVLPFHDLGSYGQDGEVFAALELGLPALLAAELARNPKVAVVERARLGRAGNRAARERLDAAEAAAIGGRVGASHVVMGDFVDYYGKFRLNARVVAVPSGEIIAVVSNDDRRLQDRAELQRILATAAGRIGAAVGAPPPGNAPASTAIPAEAISLFSRGLLAESRGDGAKAADYYRRALTAAPDFEAAQEALRRTRST